MKTSQSRVGNQQTQPRMTPSLGVESRNRTQATLVGGECSHHCAGVSNGRGYLVAEVFV